MTPTVLPLCMYSESFNYLDDLEEFDFTIILIPEKTQNERIFGDSIAHPLSELQSSSKRA